MIFNTPFLLGRIAMETHIGLFKARKAAPLLFYGNHTPSETALTGGWLQQLVYF